MTMSVGDLPFRPEGDSYLDFSLNSKIADPNEKVFNYSNISAYLVGVALTEALEMYPASLLKLTSPFR